MPQLDIKDALNGTASGAPNGASTKAGRKQASDPDSALNKTAEVVNRASAAFQEWLYLSEVGERHASELYKAIQKTEKSLQQVVDYLIRVAQATLITERVPKKVRTFALEGTRVAMDIIALTETLRVGPLNSSACFAEPTKFPAFEYGDLRRTWLLLQHVRLMLQEVDVKVDTSEFRLYTGEQMKGK